MTRRLDALTGLRFLAAAMIVIHHMNDFKLLHGFMNSWYAANAVSFFFVLSGFILSSVYPNLDSPGQTRLFLAARAARLWPAHLATLALLFIFAGETAKPTWVFLSNLFLLQSWVPAAKVFFSYNAPSWSISTEVFFYLAFPILIRNFAATWWWKLGLCVALTAALIAIASPATVPNYSGATWTVSKTGFVYVNPLCRLIEFVAGMCLALAFANLRHRIRLSLLLGTTVELGAVALFIANGTYIREITMLLFGDLESAASQWALYSGGALLVGTTVMIFTMALGMGYVSRILGSKLAVFLGDISFSIYMLHYAILLCYTRHKPLFETWSRAETIIVFLLVLTIASMATWKFIEMPARRRVVEMFRPTASTAVAYHQLPLGTSSEHLAVPGGAQ